MLVALNSIGIKLIFVLAALKERHSCEYVSLPFCVLTLCAVSVSALQIVFSISSCETTAKWETCQIFKEDRLLGRV